MRILLTVAAGFLGSHLLKKLLDFDHELIGIDDLSSGYLENIKNLESNSHFTFIKHDIRKPIKFEVDAILNFACPASPVSYQKDPVRTI